MKTVESEIIKDDAKPENHINNVNNIVIAPNFILGLIVGAVSVLILESKLKKLK